MSKKLYLTATDVEKASRKLVKKLKYYSFDPQKTLVVGIGRGGFIPAQYVAYGLGIPSITSLQVKSYDDKTNSKGENEMEISGVFMLDFDSYDTILLVDDLVDTGDTIAVLIDLLEQVSDEIREEYAQDLIVIPCVTYTQESKDKSRRKGIIYGECLPRTKKGKKRWVEFPWDTFMGDKG